MSKRLCAKALVCKRGLCVTRFLCKSVCVYDCLCLCVKRLFVNEFVCMNVFFGLFCFCLKDSKSVCATKRLCVKVVVCVTDV